jgi:hypothetical protein
MSSPGSRGTVVVYSPPGLGYAHHHESITRSAIAKRVAALKGFAFSGEYDPATSYLGPLYFVPSDVLIGSKAEELGIRDENDLFGGVVPASFVATKVITHGLVDPEAFAPPAWAPEFGRRIEGCVLSGFSAFTHADAREAGRRLLAQGPARTKPVRATGGLGQTVVSTMAELDAVLDEIDQAEMSTDGLVLEENLSDVTTYSVGQVCVADLTASYYGVQELTPDNAGTLVYGGSDLVLVRGDFDALLRLDLGADILLAIDQARAYDAAAEGLYAGFFASRRNYDVATGLDARGRRRTGVLEQSWRMGGASGAEIAALDAFRAEPWLQIVHASTVERYGRAEAPDHAIVYFRGEDERVGPLLKYTLVTAHGDPRLPRRDPSR